MSAALANRMDGKVCLVTGATHGIGRVTAGMLARLGATLIIHGRDPVLTERTAEEIRRKTNNQAVSIVVADFASLGKVRRLAADVAGRHGRLDVLVNNAGTTTPRYRRTEDGFEWHFGVNHLAPFLLTNLLLDTIRESAPARIVNVASAAHRRASIDFDDLDLEKNYNTWMGYSISKLENILFTIELARRLEGSGVTANCLHPGGVATNIFGHGGTFIKVATMLARPLLISAEKGAETQIYLATSPEVVAISGKYFDKCQIATPSPQAQDMETAKRLWDVSAKLTGLAA
jgi:retinol dehydrogenase-12